MPFLVQEAQRLLASAHHTDDHLAVPGTLPAEVDNGLCNLPRAPEAVWPCAVRLKRTGYVSLVAADGLSLLPRDLNSRASSSVRKNNDSAPQQS